MKYYCTFGQNHVTLSGIPMKDYYLVFDTNSNPPLPLEQIVVSNIFRNWCGCFMETAVTYSMIYPEDEFDSSFFPKGDFYKVLKETREKNKLIAGIIDSLADNSKNYEKLEDSSYS